MDPRTIAEIQEIVRSQPELAVRGAGTKTALGPPGEAAVVEMSGLSGLLEYHAGEFTFTALAGTPVGDVEQALAQHGQFLPFDPVLVERGATLGGTVASGLSGPGRYRYGGVRDFILGVRLVDGLGNLVSAGGKVVKNAAGFDLPKLVVGSLGRFGVLVELSFKVFPRPAAAETLSFIYNSFNEAVFALNRLAGRPLELLALELDPEGEQAAVRVRLAGAPDTFTARRRRLTSELGRDAANILEAEADAGFWRARREFAWVPPGSLLVKVPITPQRVGALDLKLSAAGAMRQYSAGLSQAWVAWPGATDDLSQMLSDLGLSGLAVLSPVGRPLDRLPGRDYLGIHPDDIFYRRVRAALDPLGKLEGYAAHYSR